MARPPGTGGRFVRWAPAKGNETTGHLFIAPALLRAIGDPERVMIERDALRLTIRPTRRATGYAVVIPGGTRGGQPRISVGRETAERLGLESGRYEALVQGSAIAVVARTD